MTSEKTSEKCYNEQQIYLDKENRNIELENKFKLHIGKPYRVQQGMETYDGVMTSCRIHVCDKGFKVLKVTLEDGLFFDGRVPWEKFPFDRKGIATNISAFGFIIDEEGFKRVRERRQKI